MQVDCPERADGCLLVYKKLNTRQVCCENPACLAQRKRKNWQNWYLTHKEYRREYQNGYLKGNFITIKKWLVSNVPDSGAV